MSSCRWTTALAAALAVAAFAGCRETAAPEPPATSLYAFDVSITGDSLTRSLTGRTEVQTMANGHSEPWPWPDGRMVGTDRTVFSLIPGPGVAGLSIVLLGPYGTGEFTLRPRGTPLDPTARTFEASYSIELGPGEWLHYRIDGGTVTVGRDGDRRTLSFALSAETADVVRRGAHARFAPIPIELSGSAIELPR